MKSLYYIIRDRLKRRRQYTIRYTFSFFLAIALVMGFANVITKSQPSLTLSTSASSVQVGEIFFVDVFAEVFEPVNAVHIEITFDPALLQIVAIDKTQSVLSLWTNEPLVKDNTIVLEGGTFRRGFVGRHKITQLEVKVLAPGIAEFATRKIEYLAGDGTGRRLQAGLTNTVRVATRDSSFVDLTGVAKIDVAGVVTLREVSIFMADWASQGYVHDFNNDGKMNFIDFSILLSRVIRS